MSEEKKSVEEIKQAILQLESTLNKQISILGDKKINRIKSELDTVWNRLSECPGWY